MRCGVPPRRCSLWCPAARWYSNDQEAGADSGGDWPIEVSLRPRIDDVTRVYEVLAIALDDNDGERAKVGALLDS